MPVQIAVRIPDELADALDDIVATGKFESRAEAVRSALVVFLDVERRRRIGEAIAEGYRRIPQTDEEISVAREAAIRSINEEPW
jgi:Arc/MetJ-type ribon-helix-helix transcriptional regulator